MLQLGRGGEFGDLRAIGDIGSSEQPVKPSSLDHQARQAGVGFCALFIAGVRNSWLQDVLEAERLGESKKRVANGWHVGLSGVIEHRGLEEAPGEVPWPPALLGRGMGTALSPPG